MATEMDPTATGPVLHRLVRAGVQSHGQLLTTGELAVCRRYLALPVGAGHFYARLLHRVRDIFRVDGSSDEDRTWLPILEESQLVDGLVPWSRRRELLRVPELAAACRSLGLPTRGRRAQLLERLEPHVGYSTIAMLRVRHRGLFRRLQRLFLRHPRADYRVVVLDALGVMRKPVYQPSPSAPAFSNRRALLRFEQARGLLDLCREGEPALPFLPQALRWLEEAPVPTPATRHFSSRRVAASLAALGARELERAKQPQLAVAVYQRLLADGTLEPGSLAPRAVLATEAAGHREQALRLAQSLRRKVDPAAALALDRTGRRLAHRLKQPWNTQPPTKPPVRRLQLPAAAERGHRPLYSVRLDERDLALPVERALIVRLHGLGRRVLHGESAPWSTLFALLFYDLYFLPVPGMLPVPWLSGPLDLGRPAFAEQRRAPLENRLADITAGMAPELIAINHAAHHGEALAGAHWQRASADDLSTIARALGGPALAMVLSRLAFKGWKARRGLPDLVVLPGPTVEIPDAEPSSLPPGLLLAEVKGPGDQVRDAQAAWFHLLLDAHAPVELWHVARVEPVPQPRVAHAGQA